jgi:hypothetical protein
MAHKLYSRIASSLIFAERVVQFASSFAGFPEMRLVGLLHFRVFGYEMAELEASIDDCLRDA